MSFEKAIREALEASVAPAALTVRQMASPGAARDVVITSEHRDRVGDIVRVDGGDLTNYRRNPAVLLQHGHTAEFPVIGGNAIVSPITLEDGQKGIRAEYWEWSPTELAKRVADMWEARHLRATSIGFIARKVRGLDQGGLPLPDGATTEKAFGIEYLEWELLEFSVVAVPMNPNAVRRFAEDPATRAYFSSQAAQKCFAVPPIEARLKAIAEGTIIRKSFLGVEPLPSVTEADHEPSLMVSVAVGAIPDPPAETPAAQDKAHGATHCKGCQADEQKAACSGTHCPSCEEKAAEADVSFIGAVIRGTSIELCRDCGGAVPCHRKSGRLLDHRDFRTGECCPGKEARFIDGPTLKSILADMRDAVRAGTEARRTEAARIAADVPSIDEAALRMLAISRDILGRVVVESKEGRVLSATNQRLIHEAVDSMSAAARALQAVLDAASREEGPKPSEIQSSSAELEAADVEAAVKLIESDAFQAALVGLVAPRKP